MKKLNKKLHSCIETVQAYACACGCTCGCSCIKRETAGKTATIRYKIVTQRINGLSNNML